MKYEPQILKERMNKYILSNEALCVILRPSGTLVSLISDMIGEEKCGTTNFYNNLCNGKIFERNSSFPRKFCLCIQFNHNFPSNSKYFLV
jgi:hypothetical protein